MISITKPTPGYQVNDYKIILVPHEDLNMRIIETRKIFAEKFSIEQPIKSMPEVVLAMFTIHRSSEERIINRLKLVATAVPAIKVEIKGFGSFPSHTIFLNVTSKIPVTNLVKKIREDAQRLMKLDNEHKPHFMNDFYITIGRKLKPWQYESSWIEYAQKNFTGKFIANRMLLLKRKEGEYWYKPIENFEFLNLPIETTQGSLF